ncbi:MAG: hypothetical protein HY896_09310 [Deltaproteobacteria bacterium]|nr:hypothetical protein [Deltaproteobacteria bacterium]
MKTTIAAAAFLIFFAAMACDAQETRPSSDEPYPVVLKLGETFKICLSGQLVCPATGPICDDLKVAAPVDTPDGLAFEATGPGTTLCSAANPSGMRRVFRIHVRKQEKR